MSEPLKYVAILSQQGANAPTANVIYNTLSGEPTFSRIEAGHYQALLTNGFPEGRTMVTVPPLVDSLDTYASAVYGSPDHIDIISMIEGGQLSDSAWLDRHIEITVYPE